MSVCRDLERERERERENTQVRVIEIPSVMQLWEIIKINLTVFGFCGSVEVGVLVGCAVFKGRRKIEKGREGKVEEEENRKREKRGDTCMPLLI